MFWGPSVLLSMAIEDLADAMRSTDSEAAARLLSSKTDEMLFDDACKLWWSSSATYPPFEYRVKVKTETIRLALPFGFSLIPPRHLASGPN